MAKIFKTLQKRLLEQQVSKLQYKIAVTKARKDIYKDKLAKQFTRQINQFSQPFIKDLREKEIEQLSNADYIAYFTSDKMTVLEEKFNLKKRAAIVSFNRKHQSHETLETKEDELKETLSQIEQSLIASRDALLAPYKTRQYDQKTLEEHQQAFISLEQTFNEKLRNYQKELKSSQDELLAHEVAKLDERIKHYGHQLEKKTQVLNPLINEINQANINNVNMDPNTILKIENLTMQFGGLKAVDDLSFDVKKGEVFGLIGPNGAGKTTVFNCITQFYKPTAGKVTYRNSVDDLLLLNNYKVHDVVKLGIVRTFQNVELIWELSILDNMLVGAHSLYRSNFFDHSLQLLKFKREEKILTLKAEGILTDLGLIAFKDAYPIGLPYGVLKKIELARTLMSNPKLIILDEPAAGLNDTETLQLAETIKKIQKDYNCTIFLVEHDMGLVMNICDTICAINFGKKIAIGTPREIQNNDFVKEAYLGGE